MSSKNQTADGAFTAVILALTPALAVSTVVINAVVVSLSVMITLVCARLLMSAADELVPSHLVVPSYLIVVAVVVTVIDLLVQAYLPRIATGIGIYLPLVVVSCLILEQRWPANGSPTGVGEVLRRGAVFAGWLIGISVIREIVGLGTVTLFPMGAFDGSISVPLFSYRPVRMMALAPGAFLVVGYLLALRNRRLSRIAARAAENTDSYQGEPAK